MAKTAKKTAAEDRTAKTAAKKTSQEAARKPNAAFMKPVTPSAGTGGGRRRQADSAHRGHQEALGLHQEERPAGPQEQAHDQG